MLFVLSVSALCHRVHGGLQYQVEHHLFPRLPRHNLKYCQKLVREFAAYVVQCAELRCVGACCVVLCCVVLRCVVLCCVVLCCVVL